MMALEKAWFTDANVALSDVSTAALMAKSTIWGIKALLKGEVSGTNGPGGAPASGSRWTCVGSSDSATAGMDNSDRWGATFDATKIVRASSGVHSWIVLKSPVAMGPYYLIIDWLASADTNVVIVGSKALPTGGSTSARPTATDEWVHTSFTFNDGTTTQHKLHRTTDADGNFWVFVSKVSVSPNRFHFCLGFQTLAETRAADTYKAVTICDYNVSTTTDLHSVLNGNVATFGSFSSTNVIKGRNYNGAAAVDMGAPHITLAPGSSGCLWQTTGIATAAPADSLWDAFPLWVFIGTSTHRAKKGRFYDLLQAAGFGLGMGTVTPASGSIERSVVGTCWTPLDVAVSF